MSSIEGKPISAFKFGFEVSEFLQECSHFIYDEVSRRTDHDEDTKNRLKVSVMVGRSKRAPNV